MYITHHISVSHLINYFPIKASVLLSRGDPLYYYIITAQYHTVISHPPGEEKEGRGTMIDCFAFLFLALEVLTPTGNSLFTLENGNM